MRSEKPDTGALERAVVSLAAALAEAAVLIGGLAVSAWGYVRVTDEVTFAARLLAADVARVLADAGIRSRLVKGNAVDGDIPWRVKARIGGFVIDVLPPLVPLEFDRAVTVTLARGRQVRVVDLEGLLRLKLRAGGPQDLLDTAQLLRRHPEQLERIRPIAEKYRLWSQIEKWMRAEFDIHLALTLKA